MPNLVGIGNSQVPTNAMLGGLAYKDSVGELTIDKIKAKTVYRSTGAFYKIFVYNTKNDSDGGAWRYRTENTSWYNEGVSKIRGARKEFPSVAVLVVTNNEIVIYDGDDPNLPMWMVFPTFSQGYSLIGGNHDHDLRSVAALNGKMVSCNIPGGWNHGGMVQVDFIKDSALSTYHTGNKRWVVGIQKRGQFSTGYYQGLSQGSAYYLVDNGAVDVAMGVQPNSRVDPDTGLRVPTIAVVSRAGNVGASAVCVMGDDGKVFDIQATNSGYTEPREVKISGNHLFVLTDPEIIYRFDLPWTSDTSGNTFVGYSGIEFISNLSWYPDNVADNCHLAVSNAQEQNVAVGTPQELIIIDPEEDAANPLGNTASGGKHALIAKDYNTGWLIGDVRSSALNSTNSTSLTATNVTSNWATVPGSWNWQNQQITLASDGASGINITHGAANGQYVYAYLQFSVDANSDYVIQVEFSAYYGSDLFVSPAPYNAGNQKINIHGVPGTSKGGQFTTGSDTTLYLHLNQNSTSTTNIKNITVQKVDNTERDRTYKRQSFLTVGTINRAPVNPGCELMYYQPADSNSYLEAPMSTTSLGLDMNFSNSWYVNFWANEDANMAIEDFSTSAYNNTILRFGVSATSVFIRSKAGPSSGSISITNAGWNMYTTTYNGSKLQVYKNGYLLQDHTVSISNQSARVVLFGNSYNGNGGAKWSRSYSVSSSSKMALARVGQTELTAEQLLEIYHDEKLLFTPNAKCTLYGSSSAVTAVAYDHENNHLHAGTSSGRSEFVGLKRINNTTTAVAGAISVSDNFVAEN